MFGSVNPSAHASAEYEAIESFRRYSPEELVAAPAC